MIDTDKYEGHTPAPWDKLSEYCPVGSIDKQLIADAPLLLEEVKRLRGWIEQAVDVWKNCNYVDRTDWFNNFCEVMGDEEE